MPNKNKKIEELQFDPSQSVSENGGVVIGHLSGPCADIINPTRNGRKYSEDLWERVFKDPITQEYFNCGGIFGELGHPIDREETDMEKIALCMPKAPEKKNGKLWATFDILDTPNGRILKTLCQYGYKMGISSRGSGDITTDYDGQEAVDPETYQFNAFDAVLLPAVKDARLNFTESLHNEKTFKQALTESLNNATDDEKKIMEETLNNLDIKLTESEELEKGTDLYAVKYVADHWNDILNGLDSLGVTADKIDNNIIDIIRRHDELKLMNESTDLEEAYKCRFVVRNKETGVETVFSTADRGVDYINNNPDLPLQLVYQRFVNGILDAEVQMTEECNQPEKDDIKEGTENTAVDNNEAMINELQEALKAKADLENNVLELQEKLSVCYAKETNLNESLNNTRTRVSKLVEDSKKAEALSTKVTKLTEQLEDANSRLEAIVSNKKALQERLSSSVKTANSLKEKVKSLQEAVKKSREENTVLNESVASLRKDIELKKSEYSKKLNDSTKLVEKYHNIANKAVDKYIELQAIRIGVSSNEIKNKLAESYTFNDIDEICEDLQKYQLNISKLPFNTSIRENLKIKTTPSQNEYIKPVNGFSDEVDNELLQLAGIK